MGKWNKAPPQVSDEFMQNQQRRKQMIIQAAKRRKQKQKKLSEQVQQQKKNQQQALLKHKQQKKDVYIKYLRNNMHDKYQQLKRNQKQNQPQIRTKSKWKKDTLQSNSQIKGQNNLEGLNLQINIPTHNNSNKVINNRIINKVGGQVIRNQPEYNKSKQQYQQSKQQQQISNNIKSHSSKQKKQQQQNKPKKQSQKRRLLQDQFQNLWKQDHQDQEKQIDYDLSMQQTIFDDMLGSKLLDSLDLDFDTLSRGKKLDKKIKQEKKQSKQKQNKQIDQIKNMIGYQSVLMSIDQRSQMIKKYNQFMINQIPQPSQPIKLQEPIKNFSKQKNNKNQKNSKQAISTQKISKPLNEGQVFNELKNKKQGKILNWAQGESQQANDLFSNCSTNKKSKTRGFDMLKEINKQIQQKNKKITSTISSNGGSNKVLNQQHVNMKKKKQKQLETIPQKKINSSLEKLRQRSFDKKAPPNNLQQKNVILANQNRSQQIRRSQSKQKVVVVSNSRPNRLNSAVENRTQPPHPRNMSKEKANKTTTNSFKQGNQISGNINMTQQRNRTDSRRSLSKQKQGNKSLKQLPGQGYSRNIPLKVQTTISSARQIPVPLAANKKLSHLPPSYQRPITNVDQVTIATQDQRFEIASFIKHQLVSINRQERELQQDLKDFHFQNKQKLKQVYQQNNIKTDYKHSYELRKGEYDQEEDNRTNKSYESANKKQTEDELQQSIQRLDDMLLRRQIVNKQKNSRITEEDNQSQSTHRSIINPMSDPISLHKQVLQLAQNLSRFEGQPEDISTGYGAKLRMKKKSVQKQNKSQKRKNQSFKKNPTQIQLSQSQDVNYSQLNSIQAKSKVSKPPQLQYSQQGNCGISQGYNQSGLLDDQQFQDSIQQKGKIQVNQRLKRMLLD